MNSSVFLITSDNKWVTHSHSLKGANSGPSPAPIPDLNVVEGQSEWQCSVGKLWPTFTAILGRGYKKSNPKVFATLTQRMLILT